jgi:hypothetical protein
MTIRKLDDNLTVEIYPPSMDKFMCQRKKGEREERE